MSATDGELKIPLQTFRTDDVIFVFLSTFHSWSEASACLIHSSAVREWTIRYHFQENVFHFKNKQNRIPKQMNERD